MLQLLVEKEFEIEIITLLIVFKVPEQLNWLIKIKEVVS